MARLTDWAARLEAYYLGNAARPFMYGDWDCCHAALGAVEAMTGTYPGVAYRGATSRALALRVAGVGPISWREFASATLATDGLNEVPAREAQRGDLVLIHRRIMGIVSLDGTSVYFAKEIGSCRATLTDSVWAKAMAWRVG